MSCILSSQGVVLATTMVVSGTLILLSLFRDKNFPPTHELVSENQESHSSIPILRSCFSGAKIREVKKKTKKKKVTFADNVKDSRGTKGGGELRKNRKDQEVVDRDDGSCGIQFQKMPANRVALYGGILRDRLHRMDCTYY